MFLWHLLCLESNSSRKQQRDFKPKLNQDQNMTPLRLAVICMHNLSLSCLPPLVPRSQWEELSSGPEQEEERLQQTQTTSEHINTTDHCLRDWKLKVECFVLFFWFLFNFSWFKNFYFEGFAHSTCSIFKFWPTNDWLKIQIWLIADVGTNVFALLFVMFLFFVAMETKEINDWIMFSLSLCVKHLCALLNLPSCWMFVIKRASPWVRMGCVFSSCTLLGC